MSRSRWPGVALVLLLLCLSLVLCLAYAAAVWPLLRPALAGLWSHPASGTSTGPLVSSAGTGTLRLFGEEPATLDPALVEDSVSAEYVVQIFSGLVALDSNLEVVPDLAERWELSPDGRTYTFFLRQEARFYDGRAVTASDVKYSL